MVEDSRFGVAGQDDRRGLQRGPGLGQPRGLRRGIRGPVADVVQPRRGPDAAGDQLQELEVGRPLFDALGQAAVTRSRLLDREAVFTHARASFLLCLRELCTDPVLPNR